jgi:hypothetical protein
MTVFVPYKYLPKSSLTPFLIMLAQNPMVSRSLILSSGIADSSPSSCSLIWRGRKLLVRSASTVESFRVNMSQDSDHLLECLKRSPVDRVKLDPTLGIPALLWWADACVKANKVCYLSHLPIAVSRKTKNTIRAWIQKRLHRSIAMLVTAMLSPIFVFSLLSFNLPLKKQWAVIAEGQLLSIWLPIDVEQSSSLNVLMTRLINVIEGNMLLTDPLPLILPLILKSNS